MLWCSLRIPRTIENHVVFIHFSLDINGPVPLADRLIKVIGAFMREELLSSCKEI
jgi:hypothetical protein